MKDGDLSNLPHKIEGLVSYRRAKITLKYTVFTFWRRYNIHTVGLWILSTDGFQSVHISLIDILVPNSKDRYPHASVDTDYLISPRTMTPREETCILLLLGFYPQTHGLKQPCAVQSTALQESTVHPDFV